MPVAILTSLPLVLALGGVSATAPPRPEHRLVVEKAARRMTAYIGGRVVRRFRVGLGGDPKGDKERQGDLRTPEGTFFVAWKKERSDFHRFLGLSYPTPAHARRARAKGLVKKKQVARIVRATRRRRSPPQTTPLGGYVGIHGGGSRWDWTLGCIAVTDEEVEWIFDRFEVGDPVQVRP